MFKWWIYVIKFLIGLYLFHDSSFFSHRQNISHALNFIYWKTSNAFQYLQWWFFSLLLLQLHCILLVQSNGKNSSNSKCSNLCVSFRCVWWWISYSRICTRLFTRSGPSRYTVFFELTSLFAMNKLLCVLFLNVFNSFFFLSFFVSLSLVDASMCPLAWRIHLWIIWV